MSTLAPRLARPEILALPSREAIAGSIGDEADDVVRLHLNENPSGPPEGAGVRGINRYPKPDAPALRRAMARLYGVEPRNLLVTRGADDAIDVLIRTFCRCGVDSIATMSPSFAAYALFAKMQGARILEVKLGANFELAPEKFIEAVGKDETVKLAFLCSPNNPTGNVIPLEDVIEIADAFRDRILILDEAYIEFAQIPSLAAEAAKRDNFVVLRTLSKAFGLAGARIGCAIANQELIGIVGRALPPFPLPNPSISLALEALSPVRRPLQDRRIEEIKAERDRLAALLGEAPLVEKVWPSETNFLLVEVAEPALVAAELERLSILVRWRPDISKCALRLTIGSKAENDLALAAFGIEAEPTPSRSAELVRSTRETKVAVSIDLDRAEPRRIETGIASYDHMLDQVAAHAGFSLILTCDGDLAVDTHHSIEDVAIALGSALSQALGSRRGIGRYGFALPMDEAEAKVLVDLSGRPFSRFDGTFTATHIGTYPTAMTPHVFRSLSEGMRAAIHVAVEGSDDHHKTEACFKAFGRALRRAIRGEGGDLQIPSTKGAL
jgi:histidinol-phosphate aminotransferase